jgi:glucokinase
VSPNHVIGVDLGGTKIAVGLVDRDGAVEELRERPTPISSQDDLLAALDAAIEELPHDDVAAIGVGVPSRIDQRAGVAEGSVNIPLAGLRLRERMTTRFGYPAAIENDANAAALAEWTLGAGRGSDNMIMLTLGTGVGGGLVLGGRPYRGWAELGHMVIDYDGPRCQGSCTGRGHLEALCSGHAADAAARRVLGPGATAHDLVARAREGDARACEALAEIGRHLGAGIGSLVNIFRADLVVVGGGFAAAGNLLFEPAREIVRREALEPLDELVRIVPAELGNTAGLVGAGLVAFEALDAVA